MARNIAKLIFFPMLLLVWVIYFGLRPPQYILIIHPRLITPVSLLYPLKVTQERLQSFFVFGDIDTANWYLTLAQKRINEAQILSQNQLTLLAHTNFRLAANYQSLAKSIIDQLRDKTDTNYLQEFYLHNQALIIP